MMQSFKFQVSFMCLLGRIKTAFADAFSVYHNLNQPFVLVATYTKKTRFVCLCWFANVLQISKPINFSQVRECVVKFITIFMVNMKQWLLFSHVNPSKTMRQPFFIVNSYCPVAGISFASSTFTDKIRALTMGFPNKFTCFRAVVKNGSKMVSGNHEFHFTIKNIK